MELEDSERETPLDIPWASTRSLAVKRFEKRCDNLTRLGPGMEPKNHPDYDCLKSHEFLSFEYVYKERQRQMELRKRRLQKRREDIVRKFELKKEALKGKEGAEI